MGWCFCFSSRRRHTRWTGDWSSDVCSSDLSNGRAPHLCRLRARRPVPTRRAGGRRRRSEERRVGKECRSRWSPYQYKKKDRSYYSSECHADYFYFERIEALKPAIEACGISTRSQSPMLGFHKQMDNRIKLLEEILSFRMQGVEFDNGEMDVDGHKAASDVRDEFVSVTEKLMDELAQCYNVLPQLDINNTIDHRPEGDEKWFLENEKTVTQFCRKLAAERPLKDIRDEYN